MPLRESLFVGVHLVGFLLGVHVEIAIAGLRASGAAISSTAEEAGAEGEGGERGELGDRGFIGKGLAIESEVEGLVRLGKKGVFEIGKGFVVDCGLRENSEVW